MRRFRHILLTFTCALVLIGLFVVAISPLAASARPSIQDRTQSDWQQVQAPMEKSGTSAPPSPQKALRLAWEQAQTAGAYRFTADAEQTLIPRPPSRA